MNKKVLTLCAGFLLAGSLTAVAQYCPTNGEVPYRTHQVKAATLDETFSDVKKINENYYYQLQVNPNSLKGVNAKEDGNYVLTVERDYSTGKLYLTAQKITDATLTHSLWQIKANGREVNGRLYSFVNKETGYELTFDHYNAIQMNGSDDVVFPTSLTTDEDKKFANNYEWTYENKGILSGCNEWWSLYTTEDNGKTALPYRPLMSYYHNSDSVMVLKAVESTSQFADRTYKTDAGNRNDLLNGLRDGGLNGTADKGYAIVAVKESRANAEHYITEMNWALQVKPVVAGAKVLNAAEINTMVDADNSWLKFDDISTYDAWSEANDKAEGFAGKETKFTVCKPGTNEPMTLYSNPFDNTFKAIQSADETLRRTSDSKFAGYDVLLETAKPTLEAEDGSKAFGYLYVSEYPYEGKAFQGIYNGLKVEVAPYRHLNADKDGAVTVNQYDSKADYTGMNKSKKDALQARYHWKITYYATNDSVVFEPLNASRMSQADATAGKKFWETDLVTGTPDGEDYYLNTVNAAVLHSVADGSTSGKKWGNSLTEKAAGVPVALYAMNFGQPGADELNYLTVGYGSGVTLDGENFVEASESDFAAVKKTEEGNPAYVTNGTNDYQSAMELVIRFDNEYTPLQRATVENGLYFMNLSTSKHSIAQTESREDGAYVVADMKGHVVYDVLEAGEQDFTHMPATQWVVEQQPCEIIDGEGNVNYNKYPIVRINNREFGNHVINNAVFEGQLYTAGDGKLFTIDHRHYSRPAIAQTVDHHSWFWFNCADTVTFTAVDPQTTLGYFNATEDVLRNNTYQFQHMMNMGLGSYLGINDEDNILKLIDGASDNTEFELFRAEGWHAEEDSIETVVGGELQKIGLGTYHFNYRDSMSYGYPSVQANVQRLSKTFYKIKLKDANLIDNDHKFVAINNQHKYVVAKESEIENPENNLTYAIVSLKENNCLDGTHGYAIINQPQFTIVNATKDELAKGGFRLDYDEKEGYPKDEYGYPIVRYYKDVDGNKAYEAGKDVVVMQYTSNYPQTGKLIAEDISADAKIADLCETTTTVFALVNVNRPLYKTLDDALVNNDEQVINIYSTKGGASLFEDSSSKEAKRWSMNYLGSETVNNLAENKGFYVDKVAASSAVMPQYLLAVAADSVPAYTFCNEKGNGEHGINPTCDHAVAYPGYVEGRFLINYTDSINAAAIDKVTNADKYKWDNYTRLGFVEAVHRGDTLFVLTNGRTLESLKMEAKDGSGSYICPDSLAKDQEGKIYTAVVLDGKHNNAVFSFRETGEGDSFLLESNAEGISGVGTFEGAWVKLQNEVPVLATFYNENGNHNTGDNTDVATNGVGVSSMDEVLNQAAIFSFETLNKDASATANEEIAAGTVTVVATDGGVIVKGAEGKNVIVSTILGKVVANETVNSDNETIAAPAGIVVVSVDGESFKVAVK